MPAPPASPAPTALRLDGRRRALIALVWTGIGLLVLGERCSGALAAHTPLPGAREQLVTLASMLIWAAITPTILRLAARFPLERVWLGRHLALHALLSLATVALEAPALSALSRALGAPPAPLTALIFRIGFIDIFSYFAVLAVGHALRYRGLYDERRLRAQALETELLRTQLLALEAQLRPHFLFNTLHTVSSLVRIGRGDEAVRMLATLADLLRAALRAEGQEVPLHQEIAFVERYLRIEAVRFQGQLEARVTVDPRVREARVPHFLLQPLVENAVRHGLAAAGEGWVEIGAAPEGEMLVITVRDSGEGPPPDGSPEGVGLGNTRARLGHLYGDRFRFELAPADGGGAMVTIALPLHEAADDVDG